MTFPFNHEYGRDTTAERKCFESTRGEALGNQQHITPAETDNGFSLRVKAAL